jgi:hypothetical protein
MMALQSPLRILGRHDLDISIATAHARSPRRGISIGVMRVHTIVTFGFALASVYRPPNGLPFSCRERAAQASIKKPAILRANVMRP